MQKWKLKGVASLLVVLLLAAPAIALFAPTVGNSIASRSTATKASPQAAGGNTFQVALVSTVTGSSISPPPTNANVTLTSTHNPSVSYVLNYTTLYSIQGIPATGGLVPGYYTVSASAPGYFTSTLQKPVAFNNTASVTTPDLVLYKKVSTGAVAFTQTVTTAGGVAIQGALVQLLVTSWSNGTVVSSSFGVYNQTYVSGFTNSSGQVSFTISNAYNYEVIASVNNSNTTLSSYFAPVSYQVAGSSLGATFTSTAALPYAFDLSGVVRTSGGTLATGVSAYLLSYGSTALPLQVRFFKASVTAYFYNFYVTNGTYLLAVNASGQGSFISNAVVSGATTLNIQLGSKFSASAPLSRADVSYAAGTPNWNYMNISYYQSLDNGSVIQGLPYAYVPSVAMQVALAFNDGYPAINASTITSAQGAIATLGPEYTTTYSLLNVNSTAYIGSNTYTATLQGLRTGSLFATRSFYYNITDSYHSLASLAANGTSYGVVMQVNYNTTEMQYVYAVTVPEGFQLSTNSSSGPFGPVNVTGHTTITIYGTTTGYGYATVSLSILTGSTPVVKAAAVTGTYAFAYTKGGVVKYYIVRAGMPINYTAQGSYDPSGGPLLYSWHWSNSTTPSSYTNNTYSTVVNHTYANFTRPGIYEYVTLSATSVTGHSANTSILVRVANDTTLTSSVTVVGKSIYSGRVYANQSTPITVNGLASKASVSPGDNQGTIVSYNFSWGDGVNNYTVVSYTASNLNTTHSYYSPGNYTLNLTVTDEVGFTAKTSITVQVNKTLQPIVSFLVYNSAWKSAGGSVRENTTVHFNASATSDPNFPVSSLTFKWDFGDTHNTTNASTQGNVLYSRYQNITGTAGTNVSHMYTYISSTPITVTLTVVDPAGNSASYTYNLTVTSQPRPDLRIINITFAPKVFTQGSSGTVKVFLINIGNSNANLSKVTLVAINAQSGKKTSMGTISSFYNSTNNTAVTSIAPNETVYGTLHWTPSSFGNFTVQASSSAAYQLSSPDTTASQPLSINQSQLQVYALYIGIVVIIVAVIAVIALRRRMPKRKGYEKGQPPRKGK